MTIKTEVESLAQRVASEFNTVRTEIAQTIGAGKGGFAANVPSGSPNVTISHNLGTRNVLVFIYDISTTPWIGVDAEVTIPADGNTVALQFGIAPAPNEYRVVIIAADGDNGAPIGSFAGDVPSGSTTVHMAHGLGTQDIIVYVYDTSANPWIPVDVGVTVPSDGSTVTLDFGTIPSTGQYRLVVLAANPAPVGSTGAVTKVNGEIGDVVLTAAKIGAAPETHTHPINDVTGLTTALNGKAATTHTHGADAITTGTLAAARLPYASTTAAGAIELATTAEVMAGTDTSRAVTPAGLKSVVQGATGYIYPEDHGAVGDGVTNDTTALTNANAAAVAEKKVLWLTKRYLGRINASNTSLRVAGPGSLVQPAGAEPVIACSNTPNVTVTVTGISQALVGISPAPLSTTNRFTNVVSRIDVAAADINKFNSDDKVLINSQDTYAWSARPGGGSTVDYPVGDSVYLQDWVHVMGIVIPFTVSGTHTIREGDTITGMSSGATAQVLSAWTGGLLLRDIVGTFTASENIAVGGVQGGTIAGAAWIAHMGLLDDTFTTTTVLQIPRPDIVCEIDINVEPSLDPEDVLGATNRKDAIQVLGIINPRIKVRGTGHAGLVQIGTCWAPTVSVDTDRLVNNVVSGPTGSISNIATEGGYGYGIEAMGAVAYGRFYINGSNIRHGFSSNIFSIATNTYPTAPLDRLLQGAGRDNIVTGTVHDALSSGFDTHEGFKRTTFFNCVNQRTLGGYRYQSGAQGFNNRSISTRFINCIDDGSHIGFYTSSTGYRTGGVPNITEFINCRAYNYSQTGIEVSQAAYASETHRVVIDGCLVRGNGTLRGAPYNSVGYRLNSVETDLRNSVAERFQDDAILVTVSGAPTTPPTITIDNFVADFRECPNTSSVEVIRVVGTSGSVNARIAIGNISVYQKLSSLGMPQEFVRHQSGDPIMKYFGEQRVINADSVIPRYRTTAGTPTHSYSTGVTPRTITGTTTPLDPIQGDQLVDTTTASAPVIKQYIGGTWVTLSGGGGGGTPDAWKRWEGTQAQYDALGTYDSNTLYSITDEGVPASPWAIRDDFADTESPPVAADTNEAYRVETGVWSQANGGVSATTDGSIIVVGTGSTTHTLESVVGGSIVAANSFPTLVIGYDNATDWHYRISKVNTGDLQLQRYDSAGATVLWRNTVSGVATPGVKIRASVSGAVGARAIRIWVNDVEMTTKATGISEYTAGQGWIDTDSTPPNGTDVGYRYAFSASGGTYNYQALRASPTVLVP